MQFVRRTNISFICPAAPYRLTWQNTRQVSLTNDVPVFNARTRKWFWFVLKTTCP